jgi:predicted negative regulator of RcsB-dependent stress response
VTTYQTDEEKVEALKKWWKDNGKAIIGGAIVGLALVAGWQGWQRYSRGQAELAGGYYSEFTNTVQTGKTKQAMAQGQRLIDQFGKSAYASFAALELAKLAYQQDKPEQAKTRLQWVIDHANDPVLSQLARLRLGQLLLDQGDLAGAKTLAASSTADGYAAQFAELRGDIAAAAGDQAAAAKAYQEALAVGAQDVELLRIKLADTGHAPAS